jgi:Zn-dependent membrane protease YugP
MNLGLATFIVGLLADTAAIKRVGTPVMGASILLGLLTAAMRMRAEARSSMDAA